MNTNTMISRPRKREQMCPVIKTSTNKNTEIKKKPLYDCYLRHDQFFKVWGEVIDDAVHGTRKCDTTDKQDCQNHIGEQCCEVHHLSQHADLLQTV